MNHRLGIVLSVTYFFSRVAPALILLAALWLFHQTIQLLAAGGDVPAYISVLGHASRARGFAFLLGILGVVYGLHQRSARRRMERAVAKELAVASTE